MCPISSAIGRIEPALIAVDPFKKPGYMYKTSSKIKNTFGFFSDGSRKTAFISSARTVVCAFDHLLFAALGATSPFDLNKTPKLANLSRNLKFSTMLLRRLRGKIYHQNLPYF